MTRSKTRRAVQPARVEPKASGFPLLELPEHIRIRIWEHLAAMPRVVGLYEHHDLTFPMFPWDEEEPETIFVSRTRPPAMLGVCKESRRVGMVAYKVVNEGLSLADSELNVPIYVNPEVDIIYRGKIACSGGDAFRVRCKDFMIDTVPVSGTRKLAVDPMALTKRVLPDLVRHRELVVRLGEDGEYFREKCDAALAATPVTEIAACVKQGLREVIVVIGNKEDESEFTLVPFVTRPEDMSHRENKIMQGVEVLRAGLEEYWKKKQEEEDESFLELLLPELSVMAVQRMPLKSFTLFSKLPPEIQDMVWRFAHNTPQLQTLTTSPTEGNSQFVVVNRLSSLLHTCQASRTVCGPRDTEFYLGRASQIRQMDTVRLWLRDLQPRAFSKFPIDSLGIVYPYDADKFTAADIKSFTGLREVVILLGPTTSRCEIEMVAADYRPPAKIKTSLWLLALVYADDLKDDMLKISRRWKAYQKRRVKQGKSSPDWIPPSVRVVELRSVSQTVNPYAN